VGGGGGGGDSLPREAVSGGVSIDGKPLAKGLITFLPADAETATQGGGPILDGKYTIPRDQGLVPGKYKVVVSSPENKPEKFPDQGFNNNAPGMLPIPPKEVVPSQYNTDSLLTAEVKAGAKNMFDFNLTSVSMGSK